MTGRRRTLLLTLLALAAPLPAFAIAEGALRDRLGPGPAAISVSTSLDSCGVLEDGVVCKLDVSFDPVDRRRRATRATVTRADGSVIDYGAVAPGGTSLWVPYVGSGNYSVRITAYGEPESPEGRRRPRRGDRDRLLAAATTTTASATPAEGDASDALDPRPRSTPRRPAATPSSAATPTPTAPPRPRSGPRRPPPPPPPAPRPRPSRRRRCRRRRSSRPRTSTPRTPTRTPTGSRTSRSASPTSSSSPSTRPRVAAQAETPAPAPAC